MLIGSVVVLFIGLFAASNAGPCKLSAGDVTTLNFALTYEQFDSTFFVEGLKKFNQTDFARAGYNATVYVYVTLIAKQEVGHANFLRATLQGNGCVAVPPCVYNFSKALTSVGTFLATARLLEQTGVSAYDGSINAIRDPTLRVAAATIATVEARHSAVLNQINRESPFPSPFDTPLNGSQVLAVAAAFIVSCPFNISLPTPIACNYTGFANTLLEPYAPAVKPARCQIFESDLVTLNFALTLEYLEATFYQQVIAKFDVRSFSKGAAFYAYLQMVAEHEQIHVQTLKAVIEAYGCRAVPACVYNFTAALTNTTTAILTAASLEQVGVSAYDSAINTIRDAGYRQVAATIATVEARHSAFFYEQVPGVKPFPTYIEPTLTAQQVIAAASQFIKSCPYTVQGPLGPVNLTCPFPQNSILIQVYTSNTCATRTMVPTRFVIDQCYNLGVQGSSIQKFQIAYGNVEQSFANFDLFTTGCSPQLKVGNTRLVYPGQCTTFNIGGGASFSFIANF